MRKQGLLIATTLAAGSSSLAAAAEPPAVAAAIASPERTADSVELNENSVVRFRKPG